MDIKGLNSTALRPDSHSSGIKNQDAKDRSGSAAQSDRSNSSESVTLTQAAQAMHATGGAGNDAPFDAVRVAELREAIRDGQYPIDNGKLADRMIDLERLLR